MIHRALFGSVERFMAVLIEHYAGALPTWLCPEQVRVLPVRDDDAPYAESVRSRLLSEGIRVSVAHADEPLKARVRKAKLEKLPYVLVVGPDDSSVGTVGVNRRGSSQAERGIDLDAFVLELQREVAAHGLPEVPNPR
jgi:threonyl-tRNA synthetase